MVMTTGYRLATWNDVDDIFEGGGVCFLDTMNIHEEGSVVESPDHPVEACIRLL